MFNKNDERLIEKECYLKEEIYFALALALTCFFLFCSFLALAKKLGNYSSNR